MAEIDKASIENLSEVERGVLFHLLGEKHPRVLRNLLDQINDYRVSEAARQAMPAHPFTAHETVPGMSLCYWRFGAGTCLRPAGSGLHISAPAPSQSMRREDMGQCSNPATCVRELCRVHSQQDDPDHSPGAADVLPDITCTIPSHCGTAKPTCAGLTARWCPVHGDCTCPEQAPISGSTQISGPMVDPDCGLHAPASGHAEPVTGSKPSAGES